MVKVSPGVTANVPVTRPPDPPAPPEPLLPSLPPLPPSAPVRDTETELTLGGTTQDWELPVYEIVAVVAKAFCEPNETRQRIAKKAECLALTDSLRIMDYLLTWGEFDC